MSKPIFYEGQAVGCLCFGQGVVSDILSDTYTYKVVVTFHNRTVYFNEEGKFTEDNRPTLYPIEQYREIIANIPAPQPEAWKPKPGEWCWFWDQCDEKESAVLRKFKNSSKYRYTDEKGVDWQNCAQFTGELPPYLKEVQQ